jgi:RimJ/RimL family protein N-acetyltransferase
MVQHHILQLAQPFLAHTLRGQLVTVRQAVPADTTLLAELLGRLSKRTLQLRYMSPRPFSAALIWQEARRMAQEHTHDHLTLVATVRPHGEDEAIAVAELVRESQTPTAGEIALVVRDDEQKLGVGSFLLWQLVRAAQRSGLTHLHGNMLAENRASLRLIRGLGLPHTATLSYGEIHAVIDVPAQLEDHARARYGAKVAA